MTRCINTIASLSLMIICGLSLTSAQPVTATWPLTNPAGTPAGTGVGVIVAGPCVGADEFFRNAEINQYTGPGNSQRVRMAGTGNTWPANQTTQIDSVFIQFSVAAQPGHTLTIDSLVLNLGSMSTNFMKANLWYSTDSTFTTRSAVPYTTTSATAPAGTYLNSNALDRIAVSPGLVLAEHDRFYFRIYPWVDNQTAGLTGKYVCPQNVTIHGTATAIPLPASIVWTLEDLTVPVATGLVAGMDQRAGDSTEFYGYTTVGGVTCGWVVTTNHTWTSRTGPDANVYVQYEGGPLPGATFVMDSLSLYLGAAFTSTMKAVVKISADPTFAQSRQLMDTLLVASTLVPYRFAMNDTIANGERFYVRIYPYNLASEGWAKLMYVSRIRVGGATMGLAIVPPTVTTSVITDISTSTATAGGNVSADGGAPVEARGVCWDTVAAPGLSGMHSIDGSGVGTFTSALSGLIPGRTYHVRAYASNGGGTGFGSERTFVTLPSIVVPTVTTTAVTAVMVKTAVGGGTVTAWGGSPVIARGLCWSTNGVPTVADARSVDGAGVGSFVGALTGLTAGTRYIVRAYATNVAGTGYGDTLSFSSQVPARDTTVVVAQDGSGTYTTVQEAFRGVPVNYTGRWTIYVKKGRYHEKDTLAANKPNVWLVGEDRDSTVIWNDDYGDKYGTNNPGTSGSFTVAIEASDFVAKDITIQNTYAPQPGVSGTQAVALRVNGDRQEYINCRLLGFQDTYYTWGGSGTGRTYHKNCYIEGTVDFIFGRNIAVFDSCIIREIRTGGTLTAASTDAASQYGYVFRNCTIRADSIGYDGVAITSFHLGRPWQNSPRTVFLQCKEPWNLHPAGWLAWNVTPGLYAEYGCQGAGAGTAARVTWSSLLTPTDASHYGLSEIFARSAATSPHITYDWYPTQASKADELPIAIYNSVGAHDPAAGVPDRLSLSNYPNPFNPETTVRFAVGEDGRTIVQVFTVLGQRVAELFRGDARRGEWYVARFSGATLASGMYLCVIENGGQRQVQKMQLVK